MRTGIQAWGSEGDVRPLVALALALDRAGHDVRLSVTDIEGTDWSPRLTGSRIDLLESDWDGFPSEYMAELGKRSIGDRNPLRQYGFVMRNLFDPLLERVISDSRELADGCDMLIGHFAVHPLTAAAERRGVPCASVITTPAILPSSHLPLPGIPWTGRILNGLLWNLGSRMIDAMGRGVVNRVRAGEGLPPVSRVMKHGFLSRELNLVEVSPVLFTRPPDWPDSCTMCGRFELPDTGIDSDLPTELEQFTSAGDPPVYVTFGSMTLFEPDPVDLADTVHEAVRMAGARGMLQCAALDPGPWRGGEHLLVTGRTEHRRVFPRCSAVVHHGGAGTSHAVSAAGVPSVVVAYGVDQVFWGSHLHRSGLAPRPLVRRRLTAPRLAERIREAVENPSMLSAAHAVGVSMTGEAGTDMAIPLIEALYRQSH